MEMVFLPTDILLYLLLLAVIAFFIWSRRYEHLRGPWRQVLRSRLGMASLVILLAYIAVGLLDSIHFTSSQNRGEVISLFDKIVSPLGEQREQTYSAPFASHLYSKAVIGLPNGQIIQAYPKLQFGGQNLIFSHHKLLDILWRMFFASIAAIVMGLILSAILIGWLRRRQSSSFKVVLSQIWQGQSPVAWREILLTVIVLLIFIFNAAALVGHYHVFGTGKIGNDIFYEALKSIRTGLIIGTLTTLFTLPFAIIFGMLAGYFSGWVDDGIQYVYTTLSSIPGVLLITAAILSLQIYIENHPNLFPTLALRADVRLLALCAILGIASWTSLCRLIRAETLKLREMDYVAASITLGTRRGKILMQHIFPNLMHIILITVILDFSGLVLAEAVLSYVGVGVDPSTISWGNMINSARLELAREPVVWWPLLAAFIFMFIFVLVANLFADVVRDAFDPRLRNRSE